MDVLTVHFDGTGRVLPKRLNLSGSALKCMKISELASKKGYTFALEKFMMSAVDYELVFPSARTENIPYIGALVNSAQ
jgi:hypothetical protein